MADISAAPTIIRRLKLFRLRLGRLGIGALLASIPASLGEAFSMTFVDPYIGGRRQSEVRPDDDLEGRDPTW